MSDFFLALTFSLSSSDVISPVETFSLSFFTFSKSAFFFSSMLFSPVVDSDSACASKDFFNFFLVFSSVFSASSLTTSLISSTISAIRNLVGFSLKRFSIPFYEYNCFFSRKLSWKYYVSSVPKRLNLYIFNSMRHHHLHGIIGFHHIFLQLFEIYSQFFRTYFYSFSRFFFPFFHIYKCIYIFISFSIIRIFKYKIASFI